MSRHQLALDMGIKSMLDSMRIYTIGRDVMVDL
jgi:hypothetical protein